MATSNTRRVPRFVATVVVTALLLATWQATAAAPSERLVVEGEVTSIKQGNDRMKPWLVTVKVTRVISGELSGSTFQFVIHSPARAGLEQGGSYTIEAVWQNGGYAVDETHRIRRNGLAEEDASKSWDLVFALVEKIKAEPNVNPRTDYAKQLADVVRSKQSKPAPRSVIRALADLMADPHDSVRYWAATALGFLGPQAAEAVPALETALKQIEGTVGSKTSESGIRLALKRIKAPAQ